MEVVAQGGSGMWLLLYNKRLHVGLQFISWSGLSLKPLSDSMC
jgi:hypothetical protein